MLSVIDHCHNRGLYLRTSHAPFADNGVQIINITDPYNPTNASHVVDSERYPTLDGATFITTATIEDSTYALVAASSDNGVQINITDPYNPINVSHHC